jgi:predicted RNA-binding protein with PUA domain
MKHLQHTPLKHLKHLKIYTCNIRFKCNISLLLERMEACRHVEFTGVKLTGNAKLAAPVEKATAGPVEKAVAGRFGGGAVERKAGGSAWWRGRRSG